MTGFAAYSPAPFPLLAGGKGFLEDKGGCDLHSDNN